MRKIGLSVVVKADSCPLFGDKKQSIRRVADTTKVDTVLELEQATQRTEKPLLRLLLLDGLALLLSRFRL